MSPRRDSKRRIAKSGRGKRETQSHKREAPPPHLHAILSRFADALSFVSTATHTLIAAEGPTAVATRYDASETIDALTHGLNELDRVYNELDAAIGELR
jgi:hypothetical protein